MCMFTQEKTLIEKSQIAQHLKVITLFDSIILIFLVVLLLVSSTKNWKLADSYVMFLYLLF